MNTLSKVAIAVGGVVVICLVSIYIVYKPNNLYEETGYIIKSIANGESVSGYKARRADYELAKIRRENRKLKDLQHYLTHPEDAPVNARQDIYQLISDLNKMPEDAQNNLLEEMIKDDPDNDKINKLKKIRF
jgi:hypothetical protein